MHTPLGGVERQCLCRAREQTTVEILSKYRQSPSSSFRLTPMPEPQHGPTSHSSALWPVASLLGTSPGSAPPPEQKPGLWQMAVAKYRSVFQTIRRGDAPVLVKTLLRSHSELLFLESKSLGAILFAVSWFNPQAGLSGLIAVLTAYGVARLLGMGQQFLASGFYTYNPLLVGIGIGMALKFSWLMMVFVISASVITTILTITMSTALRHYLGLPVLSLPFVIASAGAYYASLKYPSLLHAVPWAVPGPAVLGGVELPGGPGLSPFEYVFPMGIRGFFRSLGAILFMPSVMAGITHSVLICIRSRILFFLAVSGYFVGTSLRAAMLGSWESAFADINGFNFALISMAIGGVFLVPSIRSYVVATLAVGTSALMIDALQVILSGYSVPIYTLPFNLVTLSFLYAARSAGYPELVWQMGSTPEETLDASLARRNRFHGEVRTIRLPFFGTWTVWQGFNDQWTHKGPWRYAYDFVITDEEGRTYSGEGGELSEFFCYRKPVLSPIRGRVVHVENDLPDNLIGQYDEDHNWGNYLVIHDPRGFHVEISHFATGSIRVKPGDWVVPGMVLGLCGNSGYSPQPHIHVQVQLGEFPSGGTIPFSFVAFIDEDGFHANGLPTKGSSIHATPVDVQLDALTNFCLNEWYDYELTMNGQAVSTTRLVVRMGLDGTFYFETRRGQLYFGKEDGTFYFYRLVGQDEVLRLMFLAMPRLPLSYEEGMAWEDALPISVAVQGLKRVLALVGASVWSPLSRIQAHMTFAARHRIETHVSSAVLGLNIDSQVEFGQSKGMAVIKVGSATLRRIDHGTN